MVKAGQPSRLDLLFEPPKESATAAEYSPSPRGFLRRIRRLLCISLGPMCSVTLANASPDGSVQSACPSSCEGAMQAFPHHYSVTARATPSDDVALDSGNLPSIRSAPPVEFGGPGDRWSPEALLVAAVADCFIITFRAIAGVSRLPWTSLACDVSGTVDRVDRVTQFTHLDVRARLRVPSGTNEERALRLLTKAEETCLVTKSLKATTHLEASVEIDTPSV